MPFIQYLSHPANVRDQFCVCQVIKRRQIKAPWQQQFFQLVINPAETGSIQPVTHQCQINV